MPHVVLENLNSASVAFESVVLFTIRIDGGVLKVTDKYLNAGQNKALVESLAVENGNNQSFFVELTQKQIQSDGQAAATHGSRKNPGG